MNFLIDIESELRSFHYHMKLDSGKMKAGNVIGLLGPSGSGKTMTLRYIAGIAKPDRGRIVIGETTFLDRDHAIDLKPQARRVGYLFQNYALFPNMTVRSNIECGIIGADMQGKQNGSKAPAYSSQTQGTFFRTWRTARDHAMMRREKVTEIMRRMHLQGLEDRKPGQLSGGQQQRAALARILVGDPQIVLLDEPFSALDEYLRDELLDETMEILDGLGITVFFVTHSRREAEKACSDIVILHDGEAAETGKTEEIFECPKTEWGRIMTGKGRGKS